MSYGEADTSFYIRASEVSETHDDLATMNVEVPNFAAIDDGYQIVKALDSLGGEQIIHQFVCNVCGKGLRDPHTLKCHVKTVHGEKKFSCDICDKKFPHRGVLNAHKKTHGSEVFKCDICNETIKDKSYFKKHVRAHTGEKGARPHECNICHKSYIQKSHLTVHMSIHSDEKPYKCTVCSKSFRLAKAFKEHKNMHDNNRNLKCPHCPYTSCFQKNMQGHVKKHLKDKTYVKKDKKKSKSDTDKSKCLVDNVNEPKADESLISKLSSGPSSHDPLGEMESPVYLLVNLDSEENLAIQDMETLNPLDMAQELCITTQQTEKLSEDYRPLDLSIVSATEDKTYQRQVIFYGEEESGGPGTSHFPSSGHHHPSTFENLTLDTDYTSTVNGHHIVSGTGGASSGGPGSPTNSLAADQYHLSYPTENTGRRRSVFLAEQLDYEHQGEMRVVDPTEVTG